MKSQPFELDKKQLETFRRLAVFCDLRALMTKTNFDLPIIKFMEVPVYA